MSIQTLPSDTMNSSAQLFSLKKKKILHTSSIYTFVKSVYLYCMYINTNTENVPRPLFPFHAVSKTHVLT